MQTHTDRMKTIPITQTVILAAAAITLLTTDALAQAGPTRSELRQRQVVNRAYCDDLMGSKQPPAECHADIARGQADIIPPQAMNGGRTPFGTVASFARHAAVVASMRQHSLKIRVAETSRGFDTVTIDLDPAAVADLSRVDSQKAAETLIRARGQRCENQLVESKCAPLGSK